MLRDVPYLYIVENMTGNDAAMISGMAARPRPSPMYGYRFLSQTPGKLGFGTTSTSKLEGFKRIRDLATSNGIKFYENLVTVGGDGGTAGTGREAMRTMLINQMAQLRQYGTRKTKGPDDIFVSAIHDAEKKRIKNHHDDVLMAFKFIVLWGNIQRDGGLAVKPDDVDRMRSTMVHTDEHIGFLERTNANVARRNEEEERRRRREALVTPRKTFAGIKK